ncbi:c-type cytochrome [Paraflavitalea pollutisoli]|uniref:c-type cytochrome n=1 Tax=Paraflavitalea pollutisoli TaxID=3034143 RepID=UPI0023EDB182|nr:c-type cytochrome [Paraflavitalea sp. H1-2-19X]
MNGLLQYLLNVSLGLLPFYVLYFFWLRRLTFFNWNRWYILFSLLISALVPLIPVGSSHTYVLPAPMPTLPVAPVTAPISVPSITPLATTATTAIDWQMIFLIIYSAGVLIATTSLLAGLLKVWRMIRTQPRSPRLHGYHIIRNEHITANASFFGYIFLQPQLTEEEAYTVILHEDVHARRYHTLDMLLLECFKILLWFHPAVYHYKQLLLQAHEFEVDQETAQATNKKSYAHLLIKIQSKTTPALVNAYSASGIGQRVKMLFAKRSGRALKLVYLLIIPCILLTGLYCSRPVDTPANTEDMTSSAGEFGVFQETADEFRYILYPEKVQRLEDYHRFLYKGEFTEVGKRFGQFKASINGLTQSQTTGPTQQVGFILSSRGDVMERFDVAQLLQQHQVIECSVDKQTGIVQLLAINRDAMNRAAPRYDKAQVAAGKELFVANCGACHMIDKDITGPALAGIESRRSKEWLHRFIRNNQEVLASGDSAALKVYNDWNKTPMSVFPALTDEQIESILAYIRSSQRTAVLLPPVQQ